MTIWDTTRTVSTNRRYLYYRLLVYLQEIGRAERVSVIKPDLHYYYVSTELFNDAVSRLVKDGFIEAPVGDNPELILTEKGKTENAKSRYLKGVIKDTPINKVLIALADCQDFTDSLDESIINNDFNLNLKRSEIENAYDVIADTLPNIVYIDDIKGNYFKMLCLHDTGRLIDLIEYIERGGLIDLKGEKEALKERLELRKLVRDVYWYKDPRFWMGVLSGIITTSIAISGIYLQWLSR